MVLAATIFLVVFSLFIYFSFFSKVVLVDVSLCRWWLSVLLWQCLLVAMLVVLVLVVDDDDDDGRG